MVIIIAVKLLSFDMKHLNWKILNIYFTFTLQRVSLWILLLLQSSSQLSKVFLPP